MENRQSQTEQKKQRFTMIAGLVGAFAGKASVADHEDLSVRLPAAEMAQVNLLIEQGFYSNRTEFLQAAAHQLLLTHVPAFHPEASSKVMVLGVMIHSRESLEKLRAAGRRMDLRVTGVLRLTEDVTPELAREVIQSIKVSGVFLAGTTVKAALLDRTA